MMNPKMLANLKKAAADTFLTDVKLIDVDELHESPDNFFDVERIEEFAETVFGQGGVKENLIVRPLPDGGYEIISGHRRTAAIRYLLAQGRTVSRFLPCLIAEYESDDDRLLDIVLMNISARIISDAEMWKSYEIVNAALQNKKALGERFGKVQNRLSDILGVSVGQVSKIQKIGNSAINPIKEAVASGDISIHTANQLAKLKPEEQEKIVTETSLKDLNPKDINPKTEKGNISVTSADTSPKEKGNTNVTFEKNPSKSIAEHIDPTVKGYILLAFDQLGMAELAEQIDFNELFEFKANEARERSKKVDIENKM